MIKILLGNVGSGKTACAVRDMYLNSAHRVTFSNIKTKLPSCKIIKADMIVKNEIVDHKKKKSGELEPVYKKVLNVDYWKQAVKDYKSINVTIDEAHTIYNARRSMSSQNIIFSEWVSLIRRVLGATESGSGELCFITQLPNRIDIIAREIATQVRYHICHYYKTCRKCMVRWQETSEMPEPVFICPRCGSTKILKHSHSIEVWHFANMQNFQGWKEWGMKNTFYKHYLINDIEAYFPLYDTLQWDNLFSE